MSTTELIGIAGSVIILISMCFKTTHFVGEQHMRWLNLIGSLVYIYYGMRLDAVSVIGLNVLLTLINLYYIIKSIKNYKSGGENGV